MQDDNPPSPQNPEIPNPTTVQPAVTEPVTPPTSPDVATGSTENTAILTGSQMEEKKVPLPKGIYIIAALNLVGFTISFFDTSQNSMIFTIVMFIDLMLGIGLLLRIEVVRKIMMWLGCIIIGFTLLTLVLLMGLQQKVEQAKTRYDAAISKINQQTLTDTQRKQLDSLKADIAKKEKQTGRAITFAYIKNGVTALETLAVIVYLSRPKVKEVFVELQN